MTEFSSSVQMTVPFMRAWAVLQELEKWPQWTPTVRSVVRMDKEPLALGLRVKIARPKFGSDVWTVTSLQPYRGFTLATKRFGVVIKHKYDLVPSGVGSKATLTVRYEGLLAPVLATLAKKRLAQYLEIEALGLKSRAEGLR